MTLADENTTIIGTQVSRQLKNVVSIIVRSLFRMILKKLDERALKSFRKLQKTNPERIRTADIQSKDLDKFKLLAYQQDIKVYKIEKDKHDVPTLKYDIRDEHTIVGIYKQIQEGYRIPDNKMRAFMEQFIDTQKVVNKLSKVTDFKINDIKKEFNNDEHYQEKRVFNQDFAYKAQDIYDKTVKDVTGVENKDNVINDLKQVDKQPLKEKNFLEKRLEKIKAKNPHPPTKQKAREKSMSKGIER